MGRNRKKKKKERAKLAIGQLFKSRKVDKKHRETTKPCYYAYRFITEGLKSDVVT